MENEYLNKLLKEAIEQSKYYNTVLLKPDFACKIGLFYKDKQAPYICGMRVYIENEIDNDYQFINTHQSSNVDNILKNRLKTIITSDSLENDVKVEKIYSLIKELIGD